MTYTERPDDPERDEAPRPDADFDDWRAEREQEDRDRFRDRADLGESIRDNRDELPVFPAGGASVGQKNLSVGQVGKSKIMEKALRKDDQC